MQLKVVLQQEQQQLLLLVDASEKELQAQDKRGREIETAIFDMTEKSVESEDQLRKIKEEIDKMKTQFGKSNLKSKGEFAALEVERNMHLRRLDDNYTKFESEMDKQMLQLREDEQVLTDHKDRLSFLTNEYDAFKKNENQAMKVERVQVQALQNKSLALIGVLRDETLISGSQSQRTNTKTTEIQSARPQSKLRRWK